MNRSEDLEYEQLIEADRRRLREGKNWLAQHGDEGIPMEEVLSEFGLKMEGFTLAPEKAQ